jgi:hypothetical protein
MTHVEYPNITVPKSPRPAGLEWHENETAFFKDFKPPEKGKSEWGQIVVAQALAALVPGAPISSEDAGALTVGLEPDGGGVLLIRVHAQVPAIKFRDFRVIGPVQGPTEPLRDRYLELSARTRRPVAIIFAWHLRNDDARRAAESRAREHFGDRDVGLGTGVYMRGGLIDRLPRPDVVLPKRNVPDNDAECWGVPRLLTLTEIVAEALAWEPPAEQPELF